MRTRERNQLSWFHHLAHFRALDFLSAFIALMARKSIQLIIQYKMQANEADRQLYPCGVSSLRASDDTTIPRRFSSTAALAIVPPEIRAQTHFAASPIKKLSIPDCDVKVDAPARIGSSEHLSLSRGRTVLQEFLFAVNAAREKLRWEVRWNAPFPPSTPEHKT